MIGGIRCRMPCRCEALLDERAKLHKSENSPPQCLCSGAWRQAAHTRMFGARRGACMTAAAMSVCSGAMRKMASNSSLFLVFSLRMLVSVWDESSPCGGAAGFYGVAPPLIVCALVAPCNERQ